MANKMRGAKPSPRYRLASATPHTPVGTTPPTFLYKPVETSMWGNDVYGDCTVAEEAFAKACQPGVFITDEVVLAWAKTHGDLNGAIVVNVIDQMEKRGFHQDKKTYDDGAPLSVDWTSAPTLQNAISHGPVKIGVAADQLQTAVEKYGDKTGWFGIGFTQDTNEDHCVSLCGYGSISWLAGQLGATVPAGVNGDDPAYALYTWNSIGVIDVPSLMAITQEAWLRNPTTTGRGLTD